MRWALALSSGLLAAGGALAQQTLLEPSAALGCMTPAADQRGTPEFPFVAFKQGLNGRVQVRLRFAAADSVPAMTVLAQEGDDSFVEAVRAHVRTLRVPCHDGSDRAVELDFEFLFRPGDPVAPAVPQDPAAAAHQRQLACMTRQDGAVMPGYPRQALLNEVQGRVLVQMRFDAPDKPPVVRMLPRVGGDAVEQRNHATRVFLAPLRDWVDGYRLPCLQDAPLTLTQTYVYVLEGSAYGFKPGLGLREVLPMVRNIRLQRLRFDTGAMGCPFDLAMVYRQPNLANHVREIGKPDPARGPLLDWLRQSQFDLPEKALDAVYGDELKFTVPCLKIDLNPTGETS